MDLRRLEYFLAVVQHGQVTSAASALRVAQPSLSQAIKALERDLGVQLFTREGRTLRPTRAGRALVEPARRVLGDLDTARAAVADVVELAAGWLDIAAHELLGRDPLVAALAAFHERYAGIPVRVHSPRDEDELVRLLADGRCELGLAFLPVPDAGLVVRPLGAQDIWVVLPPDADVPADPQAPMPLGALHDVAFVDSMRGFASPRSVITAALREEKVLIRPVVRTRHRESILPMVVAGVGGTFTTERVRPGRGPGRCRRAAAGAIGDVRFCVGSPGCHAVTGSAGVRPDPARRGRRAGRPGRGPRGRSQYPPRPAEVRPIATTYDPTDFSSVNSASRTLVVRPVYHEKLTGHETGLTVDTVNSQFARGPAGIADRSKPETVTGMRVPVANGERGIRCSKRLARATMCRNRARAPVKGR